jgi:hypothetical protein
MAYQAQSLTPNGRELIRKHLTAGAARQIAIEWLGEGYTNVRITAADGSRLDGEAAIRKWDTSRG